MAGAQGLFALAAYVLVTELVGPAHRALLGMFMMLTFPVGEMAVAGLAVADPPWRRQTAWACVPFLPMLLGMPLVTESPRWLLSKGRGAAAKRAATAMARVNGATLPALFDPLWAHGEQSDADADTAHAAPSVNDGDGHRPRPLLPVNTAGVKNDVLPDAPGLAPAPPPVSLWDVLRCGPARLRLLVSMLAWGAASFLFYGQSIAFRYEPRMGYVCKKNLARHAHFPGVSPLPYMPHEPAR